MSDYQRVDGIGLWGGYSQPSLGPFAGIEISGRKPWEANDDAPEWDADLAGPEYWAALSAYVFAHASDDPYTLKRGGAEGLSPGVPYIRRLSPVRLPGDATGA